jgi:hypothetical protein
MLTLLRCCCLYLLVTLPLAALPAAPGPEPSLEFIQNKGQWESQVRYQAALPAGRLFVQPNALTYAFLDPAALRHHGTTATTGTQARALPPSEDIAAHAYTVHFEQASAQTKLSADLPTAGERNYFRGSDTRKWARHVAAFRRLRYHELWPGIDLTLYENAGQHLEYDVLLAPGARPARVALRYEGASSLTLDAAGNLVIKTSVGTTTEQAPKAWQTAANGEQRAVACRYVLTGSTVTFALGAYDHSRALTIDPTVLFSTLTGSTADNWGFTATYDNVGNLYSGGIVFDTGGAFPSSAGAYRTTFSSVIDMALIKYNTSVKGPAARVWATYLGGNNCDFPHSLVTNARNELTMLGSTSSTNYPTTTGALQRSFGGGTRLDPFNVVRDAKYFMTNGADLVVTRLSAGGDALLASTYLGGTANDGVLPDGSALGANYGDAFRSDVLLDAATNDVFVTSSTSSTDFPGLGTGPSFGAVAHGGTDAVVCRLSANLGAVRWAGLLGGREADAAYSIQQDAQGRVFVCGGTTSANFPATSGAYKTVAPGNVDGFVARISADGRTLERATFIGTDTFDVAQFLQLDGDGNAYLFGQTLGDFPTTKGLYHTKGGTQFIQKLDPDLNYIYSTAFGSEGPHSGPDLVPTAFLVDDCERIYISGWGGADNRQNGKWLGGTTYGLPITAGAVQPASDGSDFYLAQFDPGMTGLKYATFFGEQGSAEHVDGGTSRFDKRGIVYQAVCASCRGTQGFPVPPGAGSYSTRNGSTNCNNGAFKMSFDVPLVDPGPRRFVCVDGGPITLGGSPAGGVWTGPGVSAAVGGGYTFEPAKVGPGQYNIQYQAVTAGVCQAARRVRYIVAPPIVPTFTPVPPQCLTNGSTALSATPAGGTFAGPGVSSGRFNPAAAGVGTHTLSYSIADSLGCGISTRQVVVTSLPKLVAGPDSALCADQIQAFQLRGFSPPGGTWSGRGASASGFFTPPNTNNRGGLFDLFYTVKEGPCESTVKRRIILAPTNAVNVSLNLPVCATAPQYGGLAPFDCPLKPVLPGGVYTWNFGDGTPTTTPDTVTHLVHRYERPGTYLVSLTARYIGCEVITQFAPLEVGQVFVPNIITPNSDKQNETFRPLFSCQPASLKVFSRWGQAVFETESYRNDWDASNLSAGIYYYLLRDAEGRTAKGWVEVRR